MTSPKGATIGMTGTPTMLLGVSNGDSVKLVRMMVGAPPFARFKEETDKRLADAPDKKY